MRVLSMLFVLIAAVGCQLVQPRAATPTATPDARAIAQQTATARIGNAQASATARVDSAQATATARVDSAQATSTARAGNAQATATARAAAAASTPTPTALITDLNRLLDNQAAAVTAGSIDRYLATFAPATRDAQRTIFERIRKAPIGSYSVKLSPSARPSGTDVVTNVSVYVRYTFKNIDDNPFIHELKYDFAREGSGWIVSKVDVDDNPPFWQTDDVVLRETPHFLMFARPAAAGRLDDSERDAEAAYTALQRAALPLEPKYVAYLTQSTDDFRRLTGRGTTRVLGVAISRYELTSDAIQITSRAFYINGAGFDRKDIGPNEEAETFTHELVHLAFSKVTRPFTPVWLSEGAAVSYANSLTNERKAQLASKPIETSLPKLTTVDALGEYDPTGQSSTEQYLFSGMAYAYIVEKYGDAKARQFYNAFTAVTAAEVREALPNTSFASSFVMSAAMNTIRERETNEAVQSILGTTLEVLDADVKAWIAR